MVTASFLDILKCAVEIIDEKKLDPVYFEKSKKYIESYQKQKSD